MAILQEYYNINDDAAVSVNTDNYYCQTFVPTQTHLLTNVKLKLWRVGVPETLIVLILNTVDNLPSGGEIGSCFLSSPSVTETSPGAWYDAPISNGPTLIAGNKYAVVLIYAFGDESQEIMWRCEDTGAYSSNSGYKLGTNEWVETGKSFMFEEYGEVIESLSPSISPSVSVSPSVSASPSASPSVSPSVSISPSASPSLSPSVSISPSPSQSLSQSISPSASPSVSASPSPSPGSTARYWVGGSGSWSSTSTANWSYESGGASGAPVPNSSNDVYFDANSNAATNESYSVLLTRNASCNNFKASFIGTKKVTIGASSYALYVYGNINLSGGIDQFVFGGGISLWMLTSSGEKTIYSGGVVFSLPVTFNGSEKNVKLLDTFTFSNSFCFSISLLLEVNEYGI